ncbi:MULTISPECIES: PAS domain S-box protein [Okeania]|uniref:PAS domain S-box protein n=1 Tax=Okeania hirsuta TaxID=1458930 RepID=A0A3N6P339_9CYAN|nr:MULTISPECIES: PAS domain S-box protein [Okeania]NES74394.1 PAS domain S-box protein [Okeania sp. SIO1H4]NES90822.1 PAS domain S-box protein [Okeania sp. SIO2B9]NET18205.1 PAS domain S-box protein [Okeania sp. SIO1H5]NET77464.1 PAS domain S-box protein [Okeania sp. SIO1F9]NET92353.1 PAS domain S-box protein [Okeania sp. SIO1H2]
MFKITWGSVDAERPFVDYPHVIFLLSPVSCLLSPVSFFNYKIIQLENDEKFYQVIFQDITSYVLAEAVIKESEEKFRATFEQTLMGIFFATLSGKIFRVNQVFRNIFGYSNADLSKLNLVDIIYAE